jgi:hypothetical protein
MACMTRQADGTLRQKDTNYQCRGPRRERYNDSNSLGLDLHGHWRLTDPNGRRCEVVNFTAVALTPDCIALGELVTQVRSSQISGSTFELATFKGQALLSFDTSDLNELSGIGAASGYRLTRLEAEPVDPRLWEGSWRLRRSSSYLGGVLLDGVSTCDLFLTMRLQQVGPHPLGDVIRIPHGISMASNCLSPTDPEMISIRHLDGARPPILLRRWSEWQFEGHTITFRDDRGHRTTFRRTTDAWTTELPQDGYPPAIMRLERRQP